MRSRPCGRLVVRGRRGPHVHVGGSEVEDWDEFVPRCFFLSGFFDGQYGPEGPILPSMRTDQGLNGVYGTRVRCLTTDGEAMTEIFSLRRAQGRISILRGAPRQTGRRSRLALDREFVDAIVTSRGQPSAPSWLVGVFHWARSDTRCRYHVTVSSRVTRGTWLDDGPATGLRHGANARR